MSASETPSPPFPITTTATSMSPSSPITRSQTTPSPIKPSSAHTSPYVTRASPKQNIKPQVSGNPAAPFRPPGATSSQETAEEKAERVRKRNREYAAENRARKKAERNAQPPMNNDTSSTILIDADQAPTPQDPPNPSQEEVEELEPNLQATQDEEEEGAEDGNDNDLEDDDDLPTNPTSAKLWEVFAQEFNNPSCRVQVLEPLDDTWDSIHYSGHNPNQLVHTRSAEQLKLVYTRKRASLTVLCANYEKSGFNEGERFQYLNSVKNEKADASLYYWWLVIESQNLKSSVVKKLDDGVGGSSSQPSAAKKKTAVKRESIEPSQADVAILDACHAHRDFMQLQTRQTQSELDLQHAAASKEREDMKIVTMIASNNDMDPTVRAKANEKLLAWLTVKTHL
ncbi:hypothetical protein CYMTET_19358 [Cymbomonas tetramitiformis]|uniref:Uncharacterized protein n=1 Tax=Cymbomonas tetramitiformis TaxID=36881 RepID=A0AAE0G7J7_9CHLO|nr:hypothetical protein CYMTET_19358 [Cymbomonas tetramitiformis]